MESTVEEPRREPKRRLVALTGFVGLSQTFPLLEVDRQCCRYARPSVFDPKRSSRDVRTVGHSHYPMSQLGSGCTLPPMANLRITRFGSQAVDLISNRHGHSCN